ncbi:hypothetical protein, partial [Streptomyces sioyaensis]|uniref:hypothetical protein n=1 Tax=Streptomyces sioyaensis TaxID=67364 RepID=UPI003D70AA30
NEGRATYYFEPLSFDANGNIKALTCASKVSVALPSFTAGSDTPIQNVDQTTGKSGFTHFGACDIGASGQTRHSQSFVVKRDGYLTSVAVTTFRRGAVNAGLTLDLMRIDANGNPTGTALSTTTVQTQSIGLSPRNVAMYPQNLHVAVGDKLAVVLRSTTTSGCYGLDYNVDPGLAQGLYPDGHERKSTNGGASWAVDVNDHLALKFYTTVAAAP